MNLWDPATWEMRWWLPLAVAAGAAGLWLREPEPGPPPRTAHVEAVAPPSCAELEDGYARAACNAG